MFVQKNSIKISFLGFLLVFSLFGYSFLSARPAAAQGNVAQCGIPCGQLGTNYTYCAAGLTCQTLSGTTQQICVNPAGAQCNASNPCCAVSTTLPNTTNPGGTTPATNVPATTKPGTPVLLSGTPYPLSPQCKEQCDLNGDNIITKDEMMIIGKDQSRQATLQFCVKTCPINGQAPSGGGPVQTTPGQGGVVGDCSGDTAGVPDGKVDLKDVEQFRKELNKESIINNIPTKACDLDKNNVVDIIDLTNYIRVGFASQVLQTPTQGPIVTKTNGI